MKCIAKATDDIEDAAAAAALKVRPVPYSNPDREMGVRCTAEAFGSAEEAAAASALQARPYPECRCVAELRHSANLWGIRDGVSPYKRKVHSLLRNNKL